VTALLTQLLKPKTLKRANSLGTGNSWELRHARGARKS
jgi:hypothetical protein